MCVERRDEVHVRSFTDLTWDQHSHTELDERIPRCGISVLQDKRIPSRAREAGLLVPWEKGAEGAGEESPWACLAAGMQGQLLDCVAAQAVCLQCPEVSAPSPLFTISPRAFPAPLVRAQLPVPPGSV